MILQTEKKYYTPEEYLTLEEKATDKHEYRDGEIVVMPGGTTNHNQIAGNFYKRFPLNIQNQNYYVYINDVRLWIPQYRLYIYPDVMVIKGKPIYEGNSKTNVTNPLIIVEVLSQSIRDYDLLRSAVGVRTDKFEFYRSIPEFQEYILISSGLIPRRSRRIIEKGSSVCVMQWTGVIRDRTLIEKDIGRFLSIVFDLERANHLNLLPDKDLVDLCHPIEPYQVTKSQEYLQLHQNLQLSLF